MLWKVYREAMNNHLMVQGMQFRGISLTTGNIQVPIPPSSNTTKFQYPPMLVNHFLYKYLMNISTHAGIRQHTCTISHISSEHTS